jgi:hypothetical protein
MTKAPISLQDLRRRIYAKAKAEPAWDDVDFDDRTAEPYYQSGGSVTVEC